MKGIIKSKTRGNLIVISGPSGAGKGSIIQGLLDSDPNLWLSVSMTSRKIRGQEVEGREYYFITREEFLKKVEDGEFLEYTEYSGNYYCKTEKRPYWNYKSSMAASVYKVCQHGKVKIKTFRGFSIKIP